MGSTLQRHSKKFEVHRDRTFDFMGEKARLYATPVLVHDIDMACRELPLQHLDSRQGPVDSVNSVCRATPMRFIVEIASNERRLAAKAGRS